MTLPFQEKGPIALMKRFNDVTILLVNQLQKKINEKRVLQIERSESFPEFLDDQFLHCVLVTNNKLFC